MRTLFETLVLLFLCCAAVQAAGNVIDASCTDLTQVPEQYLDKARESLHVVMFDSANNLILAGVGQTVNVGGKGYRCVQGGFGDALDAEVFRFSRRDAELVAAGRTTWVNAVSDYLNNPGRRSINAVVWAGPGPGGDAAAVNAYLDAMTALERAFTGRTFVYMTNGSAADKLIRQHCGRSRLLYDAAVIPPTKRAEAEWWLWARIAGWNGRLTGSGGAGGAVNPGTGEDDITALVTEARRLETAGERLEAYVMYRKAIRLSEGQETDQAASQAVREARLRMQALSSAPGVAAEARAYEAYEPASGDYLRELEAMQQLLEKIGRDHTDTPTGARCRALAEEIAALMAAMEF